MSSEDFFRSKEFLDWKDDAVKRMIDDIDAELEAERIKRKERRMEIKLANRELRRMRKVGAPTILVSNDVNVIAAAIREKVKELKDME